MRWLLVLRVLSRCTRVPFPGSLSCHPLGRLGGSMITDGSNKMTWPGLLRALAPKFWPGRGRPVPQEMAAPAVCRGAGGKARGRVPPGPLHPRLLLPRSPAGVHECGVPSRRMRERVPFPRHLGAFAPSPPQDPPPHHRYRWVRGEPREVLVAREARGARAQARAWGKGVLMHDRMSDRMYESYVREVR